MKLSKKEISMKILISGGGTGGHIYPALAIADCFKKNLPDSEILYVGTSSGIESTIVPSHGYRFESIDIKGFQRKFSIENTKRTLKLLKSLSSVRKLLKEFKPDIVIGTGGYVSGPVVMSASLMGINTAIHEQNVFPGITNKILARFCDYVFLGFQDASRFFSKTKRVVYCGNPVRKDKFEFTKARSRELLGIPADKQMILCVGGSGGSYSLNEAIKNMLPQILIRDMAITHVTGRYLYNGFMEEIKEISLKEYQRILAYIDDIGLYMSAADLVICSAGAITLAEVNYLGKASIVIPKKNTAENHQEYNARMIHHAGAGDFILENELNAQILREKVYNILDNEQVREKMQEKSRGLSKKDPAGIIYDIITGDMNNSENT